MTGVFEDNMRSDACGADLQHFLFEDEVLSPELLDVGFDGAAHGAEVVETSHSSIDLKALEEHESAFE